MDSSSERKVWDLFVRFGHWSLVLAFVVAYLSAEENEDLHVIAGYWIGAYVLARTVWGFIGSRNARFSDFLAPPAAVLAYLKGLLRGTAPRYLGHNPAGGAMVLALLLSLAAVVGSGLVLLAKDEGEGPLAAWLAPSAQAVSAAPHASSAVTASGTARADDDEASEGEDEGSDSIYASLHELLVNLTLGLIALHLAGVAASSLVHRENLPRAMISGRKASRD